MIILKPGIYKYDIHCKDGLCHIYNEDKSKTIFQSSQSIDLWNLFNANGAIETDSKNFACTVTNQILRLDYLDNNCWLRVAEINKDNGTYVIATQSGEFKGFFKIIDENKSESRLDSWYDKKSKRYKTNKNKMWQPNANWFASILWDTLKMI